MIFEEPEHSLASTLYCKSLICLKPDSLPISYFSWQEKEIPNRSWEMELGKLTLVFAPFILFWLPHEMKTSGLLFSAVNRLLAFPEEIYNCPVISVSGRQTVLWDKTLGQAVSLKNLSLTDYTTNNKSHI